MKNLYEPAMVREIEERLDRLKPDSPRAWGKMTPSQAMAHCSLAMQWALGEVNPPRVLVGRLLGWIVKPLLLKNDEPMKRNSPTAPSIIVADERDFAAERTNLQSLIDRFATGGPGGCTTNPHVFFGPLTPPEWAALMYKHLDHHLRQFNV